MSGPADEWEALDKAFSAFTRHINQAHTTNINANSLREEARDVAQQYFRQARHSLSDVGLDDEREIMDASFQRLLELSNGKNASSSYKKEIKRIRKLMPRIFGLIELSQSVGERSVNSTEEDGRIIRTLAGLVPSAA